MPENPYDPDTQTDLTRTPPPPTPEEAKRVGAAMAMFEAAATKQRVHLPQMLESLAFYLGNQYVVFNATQNQLQSQRRVREPHKIYESRNKIKPKIKKLLARALRNGPDSNVAPSTPAQRDRAAAMQGRAVIAHQDQLQDSATQLWRMARWCTTMGPAWLLQWWDPNKLAEVPVSWDPATGETGGSVRRPVGDICEEICAPTEIFVDPIAHTEEEMRWFFRVKHRSLDEIRTRYKNGWKVKGEAVSTGPLGYVESRMAATVGEYTPGSEPGRSNKQAAVYELYVKPRRNADGVMDQGQWLTVCGGYIMEDGPLPDWCDGELPIVGLAFEPGQGTLYGPNAVWDLIGAQRHYNNAVSRLAEHMRTSWGKILAPEGCRIDSNAFDSAKPNEVVYYKPGPGKPEHMSAQALPNFVLDNLRVADSDIGDLSGVHEVSEGSVPTGVTAAAAIKLLQETDTTQMADFTAQIERLVRIRDERRLRLAKRYYREPRLVFVQQNHGAQLPKITRPQLPQTGGQRVLGPGPAPEQLAGTNMGPSGDQQQLPGVPPSPNGMPVVPGVDPDGLPSALMQAMSFEHLAGGSCRVVVTPGSAAPKSPEAEFEQVLEMAKIGLFGPLGDPTTAEIVLKLLNYSDPSGVTEAMQLALEKRLADLAASQPDPMALQAQKIELTEKMQAGIEAIKVHGQSQILQLKASLDQALETIKQKYSAELEALKQHGQATLIDRQAAADAVPKAPTVAFRGELGPKGTVSGEEHAGLDADDPATIEKLLEPPAREPGGPVEGGKHGGQADE